MISALGIGSRRITGYSEVIYFAQNARSRIIGAKILKLRRYISVSLTGIVTEWHARIPQYGVSTKVPRGNEQTGPLW